MIKKAISAYDKTEFTKLVLRQHIHVKIQNIKLEERDVVRGNTRQGPSPRGANDLLDVLQQIVQNGCGRRVELQQCRGGKSSNERIC